MSEDRNKFTSTRLRIRHSVLDALNRHVEERGLSKAGLISRLLIQYFKKQGVPLGN